MAQVRHHHRLLENCRMFLDLITLWPNEKAGDHLMDGQIIAQEREPSDGDWCMVDLSEDIPLEATRAAHALGMEFEAFMKLALQEKLATLADDEALQAKIRETNWYPCLHPNYNSHA